MRSRALLIAAVTCGLAAAGCSKAPIKPEKELDEVLVSMPTTGEVTDSEEFIGTTQAMFAVDVRARVTGYLDKVNFVDGEEVEKGALLFQIDARPYQATFDQTVATLEQGMAKLTTATKDHVRAENLLNRNAIGIEEYDRIQGTYAETRAMIGIAKAAKDMAQLNLDFTRVTAPISGRLSRRMIDPGNLVKADDTILTSIVSLDPMYANFDIDERTMLRIRHMIADGQMKSRAEAKVPIMVGLSDEKDFPHEGVLDFSDNKLDQQTGTLRVRGVIANPMQNSTVASNKLRLLSPGLFVRVKLPLGAPHKSILITEQAIGTDQGEKFVYVIKDIPGEKVTYKDRKTGKMVTTNRQEAVRRPIMTGMLNSKKLRVVDKGLAPTDRVVVSGIQRIRPKTPLLVVPVETFNARLDKQTEVKVSGVTDLEKPAVDKPAVVIPASTAAAVGPAAVPAVH